MAFASWVNITIQHGRSGPIFRAYDAVTNKLTGAMAGKWTIVDRSTATVWATDTDPAEGSWLVMQSESPRADGSKLQVFLGFRNATGAMAGFGSKAAGLWACASFNGGWNSGGGYFGASLSDFRNGGIRTHASYTGAGLLSVLFFTSGDTGRPGTFCLLTRAGTGDHGGFATAGLVPFIGLSNLKSRTTLIAGVPYLGSYAGQWGNAAQATVPTTSLDALDAAYAASGGAPARDRETGAYTEAEVWIMDNATATSVGVIEEIRSTTAPGGDISSDGSRFAWGGMTFPREPARDGIWI